MRRFTAAAVVLTGCMLCRTTAYAGDIANPFQSFWDAFGSAGSQSQGDQNTAAGLSGNIYGDSRSIGYAPDILRNAVEGNYVFLGTFEQDGDEWNGPEQIEWLVVKKESDRALLLSRYGLRGMDPDVQWENSSAREWMNGEFYETAFSPDEKTLIAETEIDNPGTYELYRAWHGPGDGLVTGPNGLEGAVSDHGTEGGNPTMDKVFAMSYAELQQYFGAERYKEEPVSWNERLICYPTEYARQNCGVYAYLTEEDYREWQQEKGYPDLLSGACEWLTRSPGHDNSHTTYVTYAGTLDSSYVTTFSDDYMARPAVWVWFS